MRHSVHVGLLALLPLFASACVATRYAPSLDHDLTGAGTRFVERRSVIIAPVDSPRDACQDAATLASIVEDPDGAITIQRNHSLNWPGRGFQCFEPMLYVLTLGIIPADCTSDYQFEVLVDDEAGQTPLNLSYTVTTIEGWVAGVVSLLPGWELDFIPQGHSCGRAFNTAINELSDSRSK